MTAPLGVASAFTTHHVQSPTDRYIIAACEQVGCIRYHQGWPLICDETTELGRVQAQIIRSGKHGRTYRELPRLNGQGPTVFRFEPYQRCFGEHRTQSELYVVTRGTPEVYLGEIRRHQRPEFFVEDYRETLDRRLTSKQRG